ncbi:unnamed protein product [Prorocentrum cordatum]|uniref:Uncharacterized protein n=1 Tax=Prorocentrum cordatum TaxID=2364126 RepID=A0ABN9UGZ6_9DINO|nr:unnamed protein product [Polarella glacialis]
MQLHELPKGNFIGMGDPGTSPGAGDDVADERSSNAGTESSNDSDDDANSLEQFAVRRTFCVSVQSWLSNGEGVMNGLESVFWQLLDQALDTALAETRTNYKAVFRRGWACIWPRLPMYRRMSALDLFDTRLDDKQLPTLREHVGTVPPPHRADECRPAAA